MKKRKKWIWIVLFIVVLCCAAGAMAVKYLGSNLSKLEAAKIPDVDLTSVKDGVYTGSYSSLPIIAKVEVTVENHRIKEIDLIKHVNGQGAGAEVIPDKVIDAQSLQVDAVSGATYSSKVILKAIAAALEKGIE